MFVDFFLMCEENVWNICQNCKDLKASYPVSYYMS